MGRNVRFTALLGTVALAVASVGAGGAQAATAPADGVFVDLVERYLQERAERITQKSVASGASRRESLTSAATTSAFGDRLAAESAELDRWRSRLVELGSGLNHAEVSLREPRVTVSGGAARVELSELTKLYFTHPPSPRDPGYTAYRVEHILEFTQVSGEWQLASDVLDLPHQSVDPLPYANPAKSGGDPIRVVAPPTADKPVPPARSAGAPYSRAAMANYLRVWALDRNIRYGRFGNDCANFISQALEFAGWEMWARTFEKPWAWWHMFTPNDLPLGNSKSWSVSHNLFEFGAYYAPGTPSTPDRFRFDALSPGAVIRRGDVVFADWFDASDNVGVDGHLDHTMGVDDSYNTANWSQVYVSYHTNDTYHIPLSVVHERAGGSRIRILPVRLMNAFDS